MVEPIIRLTAKLRVAARQAYDEGARVYLTPMLRREAGGLLTDEINEGPLQYANALQALNELGAREVLDVGTGLACWPRLLADCGFRVTAIDKYSRSSYWGRRPFNRHFLIQEDDIADPQLQRRFDAVTCMSVMSAIADDSPAIAGLFKLARPGGLIIMSFPYNELRPVENVYELPDAGYGQSFLFPCRVYCHSDIERWLSEQPGELIAQQRYRIFTGELWTMGKRIPPQPVAADELHHFTTLTIRKVGY